MSFEKSKIYDFWKFKFINAICKNLLLKVECFVSWKVWSGKFPVETNPDLSECEGRLGKRGGGRD